MTSVDALSRDVTSVDVVECPFDTAIIEAAVVCCEISDMALCRYLVKDAT